MRGREPPCVGDGKQTLSRCIQIRPRQLWNLPKTCGEGCVTDEVVSMHRRKNNASGNISSVPVDLRKTSTAFNELNMHKWCNKDLITFFLKSDQFYCFLKFSPVSRDGWIHDFKESRSGCTEQSNKHNKMFKINRGIRSLSCLFCKDHLWEIEF